MNTILSPRFKPRPTVARAFAGVISALALIFSLAACKDTAPKNNSGSASDGGAIQPVAVILPAPSPAEAAADEAVSIAMQ